MHLVNHVESIPDTNQYWSTRVQVLAQGNNGSLWFGSKEHWEFNIAWNTLWQHWHRHVKLEDHSDPFNKISLY